MDVNGELSFEDLTFGEDENEQKDQVDKHSFFISTSYGGKLNVPMLLKIVEEKCGPLKQNSFREKQSFGFIQFKEQEAADKAIEQLNNLDVDGFSIAVEKCIKITPGRDPRTHESTSEFKNSTLVFKNLPFQLKQEKLEEMLNAFENKPMSVSYLYDSSGMFRGMAFVKYKDNEQAMKIFEKMNNLDINGRKLRIEYKRKVQEAEIVPEENSNKLVDQLNVFKGNSLLNELAFPCASSFQRKQIHQFAEKLGLVHFSTGEGESKYVLVKKKEYLENNLNTPPATPPNNSIISNTNLNTPTTTPQIVTTNSLGLTPGSINNNISGTSPSISIVSSSPASKGQPIKGRRPSNSQEYRQKGFETGKSPEDRHLYGSPNDSKITRSFGASSSPFSIKSPPSSYGQSPTYRNSALILNRNVVEGGGVQPSRQPKGPDGTTGFSDTYRKSRTSE